MPAPLFRIPSITPRATLVSQPASALAPMNQGSYTIAFWIKPNQIQTAWANLLHRGPADNQRGPLISFYPGQTRLHVRSSTSADWNSGVDPSPSLPLGQWSH